MGDHIIPIHPDFDSPEFLDWVNRVIKFRHGPMRKLGGCYLLREKWSVKQLRKIKRTNEVSKNPRREDEPIIVLRGLRYDYLLDGNRRINTWIERMDQGLHDVVIVCPEYR